MRPRCLAALALAALACARNPVSGRPELVLRSTESEVQLGAEAARDIAVSLGLVREAQIAGYVAELGARLAERSPRRDVEYRFHVVEMQEPNAFALPGGWIYVSRGLLMLANAEDELVAALAHELVHVAARHAVQRETRSLPIGVLAAAGALVEGVLPAQQLGRAVGALPQAAGALLLARYGRGQEREADRVGQALAAQAGWDPAGLARLLEDLEVEDALRRARRGAAAGGPGFFDSHPATPERVREARARAAELAPAAEPPPASAVDAFLCRMDGLRAGPDPAEGVFQDGLYLHPTLDFALRFPDGWRTHNGREAVAAVAPEGDALLVVRLQERGEDPRAAAQRFAKDSGLVLDEIRDEDAAGLPAARSYTELRSGGRDFRAELRFVAWRGLVFRIAGVAGADRFAARASALAQAAASFRPLAEAERASLRVLRLRLVRAEAGEDAARLAARTGSAWDAAEIAVHNGIAVAEPLEAGRPVKWARAEPWPGADQEPARGSLDSPACRP